MCDRHILEPSAPTDAACGRPARPRAASGRAKRSRRRASAGGEDGSERVALQPSQPGYSHHSQARSSASPTRRRNCKCAEREVDASPKPICSRMARSSASPTRGVLERRSISNSQAQNSHSRFKLSKQPGTEPRLSNAPPGPETDIGRWRPVAGPRVPAPAGRAQGGQRGVD